MSTPIFIVDAFSPEPFRGNPAAVCLLREPRDAPWMQAIAAEMNLAETAFVAPQGEEFELRWFTPRVEIDLCGHATLASAFVLWETGRLPRERVARFRTKSGLLTAACRGEQIVLDFPALFGSVVAPPSGLIEALGCEPRAVERSRDDYLVEVGSETELLAIQPDMAALLQTESRGVIVTTRASRPDYDVVSRFFAPRAGVPEDSVTGSAHCALAPYWAPRLGRNRLRCWQASRRGGAIEATLEGDRVKLAGQGVMVLRGDLLL